MAGRPWLRDDAQSRIRIDVTGAGAVLHLCERVLHASHGLLVTLGFVAVAVAACAVGAVGGELPGGLICIGDMASGAGRR